MPKKKRNRSRSPYFKGELNKIVDAVFHPLYRKHEGLRLLDGLVHGLIEQNPSLSIRKFARYNFREILEVIKKKKKKGMRFE